MSNTQTADSQSEYIVEIPNGPKIRLLPAKATKGARNTYFTLHDPANGKPAAFGLPVDPKVLGGKLPEQVVFQGSTIALAHSLTKPDRETGKGGGRNRRSASQPVTVFGEDRVLHVTISERTDGSINVKASLTRAGSNGAPKRQISVANGTLG